MTPSLLCEILFSVVGGLGIFLLGMKNMSEGMQAVAGGRLRRMIGSVTNNRIIACSVGCVVTCMIQSSSVTTVMVVGLVNSSFMTLRQAVGVILGANIGTTITGWILVLKIGKYGLPLLGIMALLYLFCRRDGVRYTAMAVMGVGMVFFGLELMSNGFKPLRAMPEFVDWFRRFSASTYPGVLKCVLAGCILTMIVQSSSATLGITIGLAEAGMIPFESAAALVLGENIGTTITALLASIGATTNARRAAVSHTIFNVVGVVWITALLPVYLQLVEAVLGVDPGISIAGDGEQIFPYVRPGIAMVHTGFNVANTLIFLPLLPLLTAVATRLVSDKPHKEAPKLTFLNVRMLDTPAIGIQQSLVEILQMGEHVEKMLRLLKDLLVVDEPDEAKVKKLFHREEILDVVQKEVTEFMSNLLSGNIPHDVIGEARRHLRMADEYESVSDYIVAVLKLRLKLANNGIEISNEGKQELMDLHGLVSDYVVMINKAVQQRNPEILSKAHTQGDTITHRMKELRDRHLSRVGERHVPPLQSLTFADMLSSYRRIKDHMLNVAEVLAGEK